MSQGSVNEGLFSIFESQLSRLENKVHSLEFVKEVITQTSDKLVLQRDFYKTICGSIQTGVILLDTSQRIRFLNESARTLIGNNVSELEFHQIFTMTGSWNTQDFLHELAGNTDVENRDLNGTFSVTGNKGVNVEGTVSRMSLDSEFTGFIIEVVPRSLNSDN